MISLAVMSLWTPPGALAKPGEALRWSLATCLLKRQFARLRLVTDAAGAKWARALGLPFDEITIELDSLDPALSALWALGKIAAYAVMREPFLHFDADVFLWRALEPHLLAAPFVAQHPTLWMPEEAEALLGWDLPATWRTALVERKSLEWNFGVFGGHAWGAIGEHYREVLAVLAHNLPRVAAHNPSMLCRWLEQWSLARLAPFADVACLFAHPRDTATRASGFFDHWVGTAKHTEPYIARVAAALTREWPGQSEHCAMQAGC